MYEYRICKASTEIEDAAALVRRIYTQQGYVSAVSNSAPASNNNIDQNSFLKFLLSNHSRTFSGYINSGLYGTVSLVRDSELGLPMDDLFQSELTNYRLNQKIAEVTQFAVDHDALEKHDSNFNSKMKMLAGAPLLAIVMQYALQTKLDYLCIAINPKHDAFYKMLGFQEIGDLKYYPSVNNAPALPRLLSLKNFNPEKLPGLLAEALKKDYNIVFH